ncbi:hypothetical protein CHS0354_014486 [Potamilus streckersoni]|uniref:RNA helicase n=1 Tax=Potamilus streckersoni TaxID=2493646 RepID=A0AAE0VRY0_9BIVA|nr:hypothetical protein CHS0354_014486 [Potamilus streckersoni]
MEDQFAALHENPDIIIATPGRFLHVVMEMDLKLKSVEYVVFDEADRLFEMGFQEQLTEILYRLPESRQTLLFSATLPRLLVDFAKAGLQDPTLIRLDVDTKLSDQLKSSFLHCRGEDKVTILLHLLIHVIPSSEQTVVFAATKHHVEYLHMILQKADISSTYIYSSLDQTARKINLAKFQHKRVMVMIVTDLAARGIDIPLLDNVINFHFPAKPKLFLHRVGRVARAGRCGTAYSLIAQDEVAYLLDLHLFLGRSLKPVTPDQQEMKDSDGLYGGVPQSAIDDMEGKLRIWMAESSELQSMQKVCENAMKQYLKSRPVSALESIKRAKQMDKTGAHLGIHPIFRNFDNEDEVERLKLLNSLKSYKGNTTIFEINSTSRNSALSVMKQKRSFHGSVIQRKLQKIEEMQQQQTPKDPSCRPSQSVSLADEELIHSVFHNMIGLKRPHSDSFNPRPRKKQKLVPVRDEENYLHYRPKDYQSEQGLQLTRSFDQEVSGAVMDITGDEEESLRQRSKVTRWDRKKKKFMRGGGTDLDRKNKIRTESGAWIAASYKSKMDPF